jgi:hypothetical protein
MAEVLNKIIFGTNNLEDSRAKCIAESEELHFGRMFPKYLQVTFDLMIKYQGNIENYVNFQKDFLDGKESLACGAVVNYELTKKQNIQFYIDESIIKNRMEQKYFESAKNARGKWGRGKNEPIENYERAAEEYLRGLNLIKDKILQKEENMD